jgi:hypothetical protein
MIREPDLGQSALLTDIAMCINRYRLHSPGLYCCVYAPVQIDDETRVFPGVLAMVNYGRHKQCDPDEDYSFFQGPPNFIVDVFPSDDWLDYNDRRDLYERCGVQEYVAVRHTQPLTWIWNRLVDGVFEEIETDHGDLITSTALPGLWIPRQSLQNADWWTIMSSIDRGVTRREHHEFMDTIWNADEQ